MNISECKLVEKVFKRGRWYAVLDKPFCGRRQIPMAHYVWLMNNKIFDCVPTGFVIHHLDHNEANDDISNLSMMDRWAHTSHHWKHKACGDGIKNEKPIPQRFAEFGDMIPKSDPKHYKNTNGAWFVQFSDYGTGERKLKKVTRHNGRVLRTEEDAIALVDDIKQYRNILESL